MLKTRETIEPKLHGQTLLDNYNLRRMWRELQSLQWINLLCIIIFSGGGEEF